MKSFDEATEDIVSQHRDFSLEGQENWHRNYCRCAEIDSHINLQAHCDRILAQVNALGTRYGPIESRFLLTAGIEMGIAIGQAMEKEEV